MKAIIPAAGIGTRLRPHTHTLPKALLLVAGKPILSHIIDDVIRLGVSSIALIVGYKGALIEEYIGENYSGTRIDFVYQEKRMGIGHAINLTEKVSNTKEPLLIILGDTIIKTDLSDVIRSSVNILGVKEVDNPRRFGVCSLDGGRITKLIEKPDNPPSNLALVGLYYLQKPALLFESLRELIAGGKTTRGEYQITDALQMMIEKGAEFRPHVIEEWFDCGKVDALLDTNKHLLREAGGGAAIDGSVIIPPVHIDPGATIINSIIGPYVTIGSSTTVENSIIKDSVVGRNVLINNSLLNRSLLGSNAVVKGRFGTVNIGDSGEIIQA